jgi:hypothetical protein
MLARDLNVCGAKESPPRIIPEGSKDPAPLERSQCVLGAADLTGCTGNAMK